MRIKLSEIDRFVVKGHVFPLKNISEITLCGHGVDIVTMSDDNLHFSGNPGEILRLCTGASHLDKGTKDVYNIFSQVR